MSMKKKPRCISTEESLPTSEIDPLHEIIEAIHNGIELKDFKCLVESQASPSRSSLLKERLIQKEVPKGWSPLVAVVQSQRVDILEYILKNFSVNIEQETLIPNRMDADTDPQCRVTALWMAASIKIGKHTMECVKLLVEKGADMNHMCSSPQATSLGSSPLAKAIAKDNLGISLYLAGNINATNSADILWHSTQDGTHLLIAAIRCSFPQLVRVLVNKGANVNCTGPDGNTPLHWCRYPEMAKILIGAGAKNTLNNDGVSAVVRAASTGVSRNSLALVDNLIEAFQCGPRELYDVYCIQAAMAMQDCKKSNVSPRKRSLIAPYIQKAVQVRLSHPDLFSNLPSADEIYDGLQEPATMEEFRAIVQNETSVCYVCSIYCERILRKDYYLMRDAIRSCIKVNLDNHSYAKCIQFCERYLSFELCPTIFEHDYTKRLAETNLFVAEMLENGYVPCIQPLFEYVLKAVEQEKDIYFQKSLIASILRLVALWIKVADENITDSTEQEREHTLIKKAVQELINTTGNNGATIIKAFLSRFYKTGFFLPLKKVLVLLLDLGCPIQCRSIGRFIRNGDFPLHLAVQWIPNACIDFAVDCVRTLLEYGAHVDAVNFKNETAKDVLCKEFPNKDHITDKILKVIESFEAKPPTLQCLSARVIAEYNIEYREYLPIRMAEFVSWHSRFK